MSIEMEYPIVTTHQGQLKGKTGIDYNGKKYFSFQGIPYAKPPIADLRFKAPVPSEPWTGVRDATKLGNVCYSRDFIQMSISGSEDCLYLNVYTPELPSESSKSKPVMVWIHGGGFIFGSGNPDFYSPDFLLTENVVIVTINYRLGILGFLNFDDVTLGIPGNAGLKDQVLALRWVKENISQFGGDANNITIFGESAGGASVHFLMLSSTTKGLFHKAIVQSGSALCSWSRGTPSAPILVKALKLNNGDEKQILNILQKMPVADLYKLQEEIKDYFTASKRRPFSPVIEKQKDGAFLSEEPEDLIKSGQYNHVPLMIGYASKEGILLEMTVKLNFGEYYTNENLVDEIPHLFNLTDDSEALNAIKNKIKSFYFKNESPCAENINSQYLLTTDSMFLRDVYFTIKNHILTSSAPIYFYRMSVDTSLNTFKNLIGVTNISGAAHADDLGYLFKTIFTPNIKPDSVEDISLRRFTKLWTTFARYGNPNPIKEDPLIDVTWKTVEKDKLHFLDIGENLKVGVDPDKERTAFWEEICRIHCKT